MERTTRRARRVRGTRQTGGTGETRGSSILERSLLPDSKSPTRPRKDEISRSGRATKICLVCRPTLKTPSRRSVGRAAAATARGLLCTKTRKTGLPPATSPAPSCPTAPFCPRPPSSSVAGDASAPTPTPGLTRVGELAAAHRRGGTPTSRCRAGRGRIIRPSIQPAAPTGGPPRPQTCQFVAGRLTKGQGLLSTPMATAMPTKFSLTWPPARTSRRGNRPGMLPHRRGVIAIASPLRIHEARGRCPVPRRLGNATLVRQPETETDTRATTATPEHAPTVLSARIPDGPHWTRSTHPSARLARLGARIPGSQMWSCPWALLLWQPSSPTTCHNPVRGVPRSRSRAIRRAASAPCRRRLQPAHLHRGGPRGSAKPPTREEGTLGTRASARPPMGRPRSRLR